MKKKSNWLKKGLCISLVAAMTAGLCGCGNKGVSQDPMLAKQNVYSYEEFTLPADGTETQVRNIKMLKDSNQIGILLDVYEEESYVNGDVETRFLLMGPGGTLAESVTLDKPMGKPAAAVAETTSETDITAEGSENAPNADVSDASVTESATAEIAVDNGIAGDMTVDMEVDMGVWPMENNTWEYTNFDGYIIGDNGLIYATKNYNFEDYSDPANYVYLSECSVCAWDSKDGSLVWEVTIPKESEEESIWISEMLALSDGSVVTFFGGMPTYKVMIDAQGNVSERVEMKDEKGVFNSLGQIVSGKNDLHYILYYNEQDEYKNYIATYEPESDKIGEGIPLPDMLTWNGYSNVAPGSSSDLVFATTQGLYTYNVGDAELTQFMSYINSDISSNNFYSLEMIDDTHFVATYYDRAENTQKGAYFTKVNPEDIPDKQVIVLAGNYVNMNIKQRAIEFNKSNEEYRIVVKEYDMYNSYDDYNAGVTQLNNDIIAGNMPDILIADSSMNTANYVSKGLVADVGRLMEKDEELANVEFLQNVFDAYKINDRLYYVIPEFTVNTYMAKKSIVGDRTAWTMEEYQQLLSTMPEGTSGMGDMVRSSFLYYVMQYCGSEYVDVATGKCNFDSPEFIAMLEYAKTLPAEINYDYTDDSYWMNYDSQWREDRTILLNSYFNSAYNLKYNMNGYFGEDVSFIGFPNSTGQGSIIQLGNYYVLSSRSANLDGAWEFVKYYLTEEYQDSLEWEIPVRKSSFDKWVAKGMEKSYYMDENDQKVEYDDYYSINGESFVLPVLTQEQVDQITAFVQSVDRPAYYNEDIMNIITEEAESYFSGQKSAAEVAGVIQSRVQIFVNENR